MRKNHTLQLLRQGETTLGTWIQLHSITASRLIAAQGCLDWLLVDCEHGASSLSNTMALINAITDVSQGRVTPIARVAAGSIDQIKQLLDCGAQGILVPMVNTAEEAAAVVRYARFPPLGERGAGSISAHLTFGSSRVEYVSDGNHEILVAIQIETQQALANIDQILEVQGIDLVFIGPYDLTLSLGLPGAFWSESPIFLDAIKRIINACSKNGLPYGTIVADPVTALQRKEMGFKFIGLGMDGSHLLSSIGQQYGQIMNLPDPPGGWANLVKME